MILPQVQPWNTMAKGLVACWPCSEGSGPVLHDVSGYGNDAMPGTAPSWTDYWPLRQPAPGTALLFDGATTYLAAPHSASLNLTAAISACAHFRLNTLTSSFGQRLITKWDGSSAWLLQATTGTPNTAGYFYVNAPGQGTVAATGGVLDANSDHWLIGTYDGALIRLYLDGVLVATQPQSGAISTNTHPVDLGVNESNMQWLDGYLFDGRIYNRALAPSEIWDIYTGNG